MMSQYDDLRDCYRNLETHEILDRIEGGTLTESAKKIANEELAQRGVDSGPTKEASKAESGEGTTKKSIFDGIWWRLLILIVALRGGSYLYKEVFKPKTVTSSTSYSTPTDSRLLPIRPQLPGLPPSNRESTYDTQAVQAGSSLSKPNDSNDKVTKRPNSSINTESFRRSDDPYNYLVPPKSESGSTAPLPSGPVGQNIEWSEKEVGRMEPK